MTLPFEWEEEAFQKQGEVAAECPAKAVEAVEVYCQVKALVVNREKLGQEREAVVARYSEEEEEEVCLVEE